MMRGPDFEIPSLPPPVPPSDVPGAAGHPRRSLARRMGGSALVVLFVFSGISAYAWYSAPASGPSQPARVDDPVVTSGAASSLPAPPSSIVTPTTPAAAVTRTCLDSQDDPGAAREAPSEIAPWITFDFSPRVAGQALALMARAASDARDALGAAGAVVIHVDCDIDEYAAATGTTVEEARQNVTDGRFAHILGQTIFLYGPSFEKQPAVIRRRAVYHEYFHALQHFLSANRSARRGVDRPLWLIEGSARFFENAVTDRELDIFRQTQVTRREALPPLADLEELGGSRSTGGSGAAYTMGSIASDYLVAKYGRDRLRIEFWVAFAATDWRSAFLQVFGVTVDSFYAEFEAYRSTLRP